MKREADFKLEALERIAEELCLAARTAPKARGKDFLEIAVLTGNDIQKLAKKTKQIGEREKHNTFLRDSENIKQAQVVILIGTKKQTIGLRYCSFCGFPDCEANEKAGAVCAYNTGDLGIAIGSLVAAAADRRLDCRVMYSLGRAAVDAKLLGADVKIAYGIPLSATGKNPFFDRK